MQARADAVFRAFGEAAPPPMSGEIPPSYRRRLSRMLQRHSPDWKDIDLYAIPDAVLAVAEQKIYADAKEASKTPDVPEGRQLSRTTVDPDTGHRVTMFYGDSFIKRFTGPKFYVKRFLTPQGRGD
jgi:hypothetical protein